MAVAVMECIDDLDAVSVVIPAISELPQQQRLALQHILGDYVNVVLRTRVSYAGLPWVEERFEQIAIEIGRA